MNNTERPAEYRTIPEQLDNDGVHSGRFSGVERVGEFVAPDFIVRLAGISRNRAEFLGHIAIPRPSEDLLVHALARRPGPSAAWPRH
ncbi:hypothetical protein [Actinacidiphila acidipaludis]|uniref:Uncharacterized protein n=1 Tax=Actinacidiphila acidipaludis TaxID=2873382 RepID=A0ABS7Q4M4_9ACTN|nr:hypothetical protein [Streptomyces acidipaludis]MBY8877365.1 hypothetical protein [Streptomyces acidipaludis]